MKHLPILLLALTTLHCQPDQQPPRNILLYIADDLSPFNETQDVDAFRSIGERGVSFTNAFTNAPSCTPARGVLLTGQPLWNLRDGGTLFGALPYDLPVFPLLLEDGGYFVGYTGKGWGPGSLQAGGWPDGKEPTGTRYNQIKMDPVPDGMSNRDYAANFDAFMADRPDGQPFFFWYGSGEPHRRFGLDQGIAAGKKLEDARVPASMPDHQVTRSDILDYDVEVEYANDHFARMLARLEEMGELENTLVIVTSDHGMPFPRAKATGLYDDATVIPYMIAGPDVQGAGRQVSDFVGLMDLGPTILDYVGLQPPQDMVGRSLLRQLKAREAGRIDASRDHIVLALERHTIARPDNAGYPMRALRNDDFLMVRNYEPDRYPAGDPDYESVHQGPYGDIDTSPSKTFIIQNRTDPDIRPFYELAAGKRPEFELFDLAKDPSQLMNVASDSAYVETLHTMTQALDDHLRGAGDPRVFGKSPWDLNRYYWEDLPAGFPEPDRARWVVP